MNFLVILMLTWQYFSQALASPFAQTVFDQTGFAQTEYSDYETNFDDAIYEEIDSDFCVLQELGVTGKSMPMFECQTLNNFDSPPFVTNYHGSYISVCCPVSSDVPLPPAPPSLDGKEYQYEEFEEYEYYDQNSCSSGTECLPLSQCDLTSINSDESPPTYCKDSSKTREDHFCCKKSSKILMPDHDGDASHVRQQRIFELYFNRTYPCEDHTDMCKTWANNQPESCNPGNEHYDFMKLACMDSCKICQDHGCVNTFKKCPQWAKDGHCTRYPQEMMFHCRESCGTCGFRSVFNTNDQSDRVLGSKQYTDLDKTKTFNCGNFKRKKPDSNSVDENAETSTRCTTVIISDRFILTAAQCVPENSEGTSTITIRTGTEHEETIAVRRKFIHPWYYRGGATYYNDIALLELERKILYDYETYGDSPTCLNTECDIDGKEATLQGFGKTETGEFPNKLLETTVTTITNEECVNKMRINMRKADSNVGDKIPELPYGINSTILCTKGIQNQPGEFSGACEGDEGGPLYINAKINDNTGDINNRTLAGIFSGSGKYDCGKSEINYWQRVSEFLPWIKCVKRNAEENKPTEEFEKECASEINSSRNKCSRWSQPLETSPFKPSGVNFGA